MDDEWDAAREQMFDAIREELELSVGLEAVDAFRSERLKSFYIAHPHVMRPAVDAIQEGNWQREQNRNSAAVVFYISAVEILLKATLLRPVIYGLVHNEQLADIVVDLTLGKTGYRPYVNLLEALSKTLADVDLKEVRRPGKAVHLIAECSALQTVRNEIVHQGRIATQEEANDAQGVSAAVYDQVVRIFLYSLGLTVIERGQIARAGVG